MPDPCNRLETVAVSQVADTVLYLVRRRSSVAGALVHNTRVQMRISDVVCDLRELQSTGAR